MKKGFTLVELLGTIVVLGVIGIITVTIVSNSINTSKKKAFEINAKNLLEASKEYVTKNMENNDFPKEGINATDKKIELKNNPFVSGVIKRNEQGQIELVNVTDGKYCANGTKSNIKVTEGECEKIDNAPPTLSLKVLEVTNDKAKIMIKTEDEESGIKEYEYCIKEEDRCETKEKNGIKSVREIISINKLESNKEYTIIVKSTNGSENKNNTITKEIKIKTKEIEVPKFKISTTTYAITKVLKIIYPEVSDEYTKEYIKNGEVITTKEKEVELEIKEKTTIKASVKKGETEIVSDSIIVDGIDTEGPVVKATTTETNSWTKSKTLKITATDAGIGLAIRPYMNNGFEDKYKIWNKANSVELKSSGKINLKVRDRLGNINKNFNLDGVDCCVDCENLCEIGKIDSLEPRVEIKVIEGEKITEAKYTDWYKSDQVKVEIKVTDQYLNNGVAEDGGVGVDIDSLRIKAPLEITKLNPANLSTRDVYCIDKDTKQQKACGKMYFTYSGIGTTIEDITDKDNYYGTACAKNSNNYKYLKRDAYKIMTAEAGRGDYYSACYVNEPKFYDIENLEYKGTENEGKTYVYELSLNTTGEHKISVSVKDKLGNSTTKTETVKIDNTTPKINSNSDPLVSIKTDAGKTSYDIKDYDLKNNITVEYGPTSGKISCTPNNTKEKDNKGKYTVNCTATGNNGKISNTSFVVIHSYAAATERYNETCYETCTKTTDCWDNTDGRGGQSCKYTCPSGNTMTGGSRRCEGESADGWCGNDSTMQRGYDCEKIRYTCPNGGTLGDGKEPTKDKSRCYYK